jgi:glycerol 3-phosphatase-2
VNGRSAILRGTDDRLVDGHDVLLLDLDGTVWLGGELIPHALSVLTDLGNGGVQLLYVTNNASRSPADVADQLARGGLHAEADQVVTSAQAGAALLAGLVPAGSPVLVVGSPALEAEAADRGLRPVRFTDLHAGRLREPDGDGSDRVAAVLQGFTPDTGWRDLAAASYAIALGAVWVAANVDATLPTAEGLAPGNGSLVAVVASVTGRTPVVAGKPERPLLDTAVARTGARAPLVVGDRLDTDLAAAVGAGLPGLHVLTGVSRARDLLSAPAAQRPSYVGADLRALQHAHHRPAAVGSGWECGRWRAEVVDGTVRVGAPAAGADHREEGPPPPAATGSGASADIGTAAQVALDGLRALAEAVWEHADTTGGLPAGIDEALRTLDDPGRAAIS